MLNVQIVLKRKKKNGPCKTDFAQFLLKTKMHINLNFHREIKYKNCTFNTRKIQKNDISV